jgi:hypothetical protein
MLTRKLPTPHCAEYPRQWSAGCRAREAGRGRPVLMFKGRALSIFARILARVSAYVVCGQDADPRKPSDRVKDSGRVESIAKRNTRLVVIECDEECCEERGERGFDVPVG